MNRHLIVALVSSFLLQGAAALADDSKGAGHPCHKIKEACEAAGFKKGDHKDKKGLFKDCVQPLMNGQSVPGVTVSAGDIEACKARRAEHGNKKK